ncbi:hypothetical protein D3C73_1009590 [compost metagenome]
MLRVINISRTKERTRNKTVIPPSVAIPVNWLSAVARCEISDCATLATSFQPDCPMVVYTTFTACRPSLVLRIPSSEFLIVSSSSGVSKAAASSGAVFCASPALLTEVPSAL